MKAVMLKDQVSLLLWKRLRELLKNGQGEILRIVGPVVVIFAFIHLAYATLSFLSPGGVEPLLVPFAFFLYVQRVVVQIAYEKGNRLQEAMKMMGLFEPAYWLSYFISEGIVTGFAIALFSTIVCGGVLFNDASFGTVLGMLLIYCLSVVPFCFFMTCFFDTAQTAGQGTLAFLIGFFAVYVIVFMTENYTTSLYSAQIVGCFFPPLALQIACSTFLKSYEGLHLESICGIMVADIFIYSVATWYFSQVWPSKLGVTKPFYFPFLPSFWCATRTSTSAASNSSTHPQKVSVEDGYTNGSATEDAQCMERTHESLLGKPTVVVDTVRKTFHGHVAVNDLSFKLYENQIFSLLGHNGAGKTTTISMLTGLFRPDVSLDGSKVCGSVTIYGQNVHSQINRVPFSMGVCPQHDVLFDNLSVREHILFFAQLKGASYEAADAEATHLTKLFHLEQRIDNTGAELSGGQRRKLSVAIAVCGGSKFVVLDEPSAGMDPLARRELWNLLASLRKGRTMLLTTHYMDEADVLGDRIGIMSAGKMICGGSSQYLKLKYGPGYRLILEFQPGAKTKRQERVTALVQQHVPSMTVVEEESIDDALVCILPFNEVSHFAGLFASLDRQLNSFEIKTYGLSGSTLEDVFVRTGAESKAAQVDGHEGSKHHDKVDTDTVDGQHFGGRMGGDEMTPVAKFCSQMLGITYRKLSCARNEFATVAMILLPVAASVGAAALYRLELISPFSAINAVMSNALYTVGYLGVPGLLAEFIVRERNDKLRNVLNVMGCDYRAYWLGNLIADFLLLLIPSVCIWISWVIADMPEYYAAQNGLNIFVCLLFNVQLICFVYVSSYLFTTTKACVSFMPGWLLTLALTPAFCFTIYNQLQIAFQQSAGAPSGVVGSVIFWATVVLSPQGGLFACFLDLGEDTSRLGVDSFPPYGASIALMCVQIAIFARLTLYIDERTIAVLSPVVSERVVEDRLLDVDVRTERRRVQSMLDRSNSSSNNPAYKSHHDTPDIEKHIEVGSLDMKSRKGTLEDLPPLLIERLRKVYPPVTQKIGAASVVAVEDVSFALPRGEVFGLLGANGAGKTTLLSMLTRPCAPTSGNAWLAGHSILSEFRMVATQLGVVTQNNALWDHLSVENHLYLFARLRGVSAAHLHEVVEEVLTQLELTKHRAKLSMSLSGGMKRKLCVAIALIGDPQVVLLDEPSAGLDPVSRRNLWTVILRTMAHRSVILTTHSMEEAEALCTRLGVMVEGQLRALGSKQHLKSKFGDDYELSLKLQLPSAQSDNLHNDHNKHLDMITSYLLVMMPSATLIYDHGGLVTYRLPRSELQMSRLFAALEMDRARLKIDTYTIVQATLEQVFLRIVHDWDEQHRQQHEQRLLEAKEDPEHGPHGQGCRCFSAISSFYCCCFCCRASQQDLLRQSRAKCGCSDLCLVPFLVIFGILFVALLLSGIAVGTVGRSVLGGSVMITIAIVSWIVFVVLCSLRCCLACRIPIEEA